MRLLFLLISSLAIIAVFLFIQGYFDLSEDISLDLIEIRDGFGELLTEVGKEILTPPPLKRLVEPTGAFLTKEGVIEWTNKERQVYGLEPLLENSRLSLSASMKCQDMLEKQYFAHISPIGIGVNDLADKVNYQFIIVGENLAMGNFESDSDLVQAWMDSPGHRENILNPSFSEIGVAVLKGVFEEKEVWFITQHFGLPLSACPQPDSVLRSEIDFKEKQLSDLNEALINLERTIKNTRPKRGITYKDLVQEYNNLVSQYNNLSQDLDSSIKEYNVEVSLFNECINEFK